MRCLLQLAETHELATSAQVLQRIVCTVRGGKRRHSTGLTDVCFPEGAISRSMGGSQNH